MTLGYTMAAAVGASATYLGDPTIQNGQNQRGWGISFLLAAASAIVAKCSAAESAAATRPLGPGEDFFAHVNGKYGVAATLDSKGTLDLYVKAKEGLTPRGGAMFNEALAAYGSNVYTIRGTWLGGGELADNYLSFRAAIAAGLTPEQAALGTFTGKMASRAGFNNVQIIENQAGRVVVNFTR